MKILFDEADLRPLIERVVAETFEQLEAQRAKLGDRIGLVEPEAAAAIGVAPHVLRDARLRGEITAKLVGRRYVYSRDALIRFLKH